MTHHRLPLICLLACVALCLTACVWRTRDVNQLPPALHRLRIVYPDTIDVSLLKSWEARLTAMGVQLTSSRRATVFHLQNNQITYTTQAVVNSNLPVSYRFTGTLTYTIEKPNHGIVFGPSTLTTSISTSMPEQSLYDSSQTQLIRQRLNQTLLALLYTQLISPSVRHALKNKTRHHFKKHHHTQPRSS